MDMGIDIDEYNQVTAWYSDNLNGQIRIDVTDEVLTEINEGHLFKYDNNQLIRDTTREQVVELQEQIDGLEKELQELTPKMAEGIEYQLRGEELPEECQEVLNRRQVLRDQINLLKEQMNTLN